MPSPTRTPASPDQVRTLPRDRRRLVELMQWINFGRIEGLIVRGGQPVLDDPAPKVFREVKFGGDNGPRPEAGAGEFARKAQVVELFEHFDRLGDGRVEVLTVKHGLPLRQAR